mgnify:CR=1 FL=1
MSTNLSILETLESELIIRGYSEKTREAYITHNKEFLEYIDKNPKEVSEQDIKKYISYLMAKQAYKPSSINLILSSLRFFYKDILKLKIMDDIKSQKSEKKIPVVLTKEEVKQLLNSISNIKHRLLIEIMLSSGLRVSEVVALKLRDIDLTEKTLTVRSGKGKKDRLTILSDNIVKQIKTYLPSIGDSEYLFPGRKDHVSVKLPQKIVKIAAKKAGIRKNVSCHTMRHSFATHLLENGTDIRLIQTLLGHSSLDTTQIYTKVSSKQIKKVKNPFDDI